MQKSLGLAKTSYIYSPLPKNFSDLPLASFTVTMAPSPPSEEEESSSGSDYGDPDAPSIDEEVVRKNLARLLELPNVTERNLFLDKI